MKRIPRCRGKNPLPWIAAVLALYLGQAEVFVSLPSAPRSRETARQADGQSLIFLAVKDAVYTALFGAPDPSPGDGAGLDQLSDAVLNSTLSNAQAVESLAGQFVNSTIAKAQELVSNEESNESEPMVLKDTTSDIPVTAADADPVVPSEAAPDDFAEASEENTVQEEPFEVEDTRLLFGEADGPGAAQAGDFFLFIKDYSWSLRYRITTPADSDLDTERPLDLEWVKLRKPISDPAQLTEMPSSDIFEWDVVEPPRHNGFMYQVTEVVGSGVEAVINFFQGKALKMVVQKDGISLVSKEPGSEVLEPRPVTHCWVQVMGLPFLPILQYIAFFDWDEEVTSWRA